MSNVIQFKAQGKQYPLSIIDADGEKWIMAQQLGEALGLKNIRKLIQDLTLSREITEGKHFRPFLLRNSGPGNPTKTILSYRGVIRVAMRSQGQRAREFRDWAEEVLFQVMVSGAYGLPRAVEAIQAAEAEGVKKGLALAAVCAEQRIDVAVAVQVLRFRMLGLTQWQAAAAFGLTRWQVSRLEIGLKPAGVTVPVVHTHSERKRAIDNVGHLLDGFIAAKGGAA